MVFLLQIVLNKTVPLCSAQYERQFNTTRIPGLETGWYRCRYSLLPHVLMVYRQAMVHHHAFLWDGNGSAAISSRVPSPCYILGIKEVRIVAAVFHHWSACISLGWNLVSISSSSSSPLILGIKASLHLYRDSIKFEAVCVYVLVYWWCSRHTDAHERCKPHCCDAQGPLLQGLHQTQATSSRANWDWSVSCMHRR